MTIWDEFFGNSTYNRHIINRTNNWYWNMWQEMNNMMQDALNEAVPVEKPQTKVVSTKIVKRNGKVYRITVEQLLDGEEEEDTSVEAEESEDFDPDFTEDNA